MSAVSAFGAAAAGDLLSPTGSAPRPLRKGHAPACMPGDIRVWMSSEEVSLRELNILGRWNHASIYF